MAQLDRIKELVELLNEAFKGILSGEQRNYA